MSKLLKKEFLLSMHPITPLMLASKRKHNRDMINMLIKAGADVNFCGNGTALMHAIENVCIENVEILLDAGADVSIVYRGLTALKVAKCIHTTSSNKADKEKIISLIKSKLPQKPTLIQRAKGISQSIQKIFTR